MFLLQSSSDDQSHKVDEVFSFSPSGLSSESYFDKIIIYNSVHLFSDLSTQLARFISALTNRGRLLIIHRPIRLCTLPLPADIIDRLRTTDLPLESLISTIQSLGLEFHWHVDSMKVVMSRQKWLDMIQSGRFPPRQREQETQSTDNPDKTSSTSESDGIYELMSGVLRYTGDSNIEFVDRMVFITVTRVSPESVTSVLSSQKGKKKDSMYGRMEMEVTPEIKEILDAKDQGQRKKWNLFD